jgi:hypothetical protein
MVDSQQPMYVELLRQIIWINTKVITLICKSRNIREIQTMNWAYVNESLDIACF